MSGSPVCAAEQSSLRMGSATEALARVVVTLYESHIAWASYERPL